MRIMQLSDMLLMLRAETRLSPNIAHGAHLTFGHISLLRRVQEELYDAYHWPLLRLSQDTDLSPGERYVAYPELLDHAGIETVHARPEGGRWARLEFGIGVEHYNEVDSEARERAETVRRWQPYLSPRAEQVHLNMCEVWPVPSVPTLLRFTGKRRLMPLVDEGRDVSTLDGPLIVLHAAAEILAGQEAEDAALKLEKARSRLANLRMRDGGRDNRSLNLADPGPYRRFRRGIDYIE